MLSYKINKTVSILTLVMMVFSQISDATAALVLTETQNHQPVISVEEAAASPESAEQIPSGSPFSHETALTAAAEEPVTTSILLKNGHTFNHKISNATGWIKEGEAVTNYKNVSVLSDSEMAASSSGFSSHVEVIGKYEVGNEMYAILGVNVLKEQQEQEEIARLKPEILARLVISMGLSVDQLEGLIESMDFSSTPGRLKVRFKEGQMPAGRLVDPTGNGNLPSEASFEIWNVPDANGNRQHKVPGTSIWTWGPGDPTAIVVFSGADPEKLAVVSWRDGSSNEIYQDNYVYQSNSIDVYRMKMDASRVWRQIFKITLDLNPNPNPTPAEAEDEDGAHLEFTYDEDGKLVKAVKTMSGGPWGSPDKIIFDFITMKAVKTFGNGIEIIYDFQLQHDKTLEPGESPLASWIKNPMTGDYDALIGNFNSAFYTMRDGLVPDRKVFFNPRQDHGEIRNESGTILHAAYDFFNIQGVDGGEYSVLALSDSGVPGMALFLVDAQRSRYEFLGYENSMPYSYILKRAQQFGDPFWKVLPKFLNDPVSLSESEFNAIILRSSRASYVLDRVVLKKGFGNAIYNPRLLEALSQKWGAISLEVKERTLNSFKTVNGEDANKLGQLFLRYLDELAVVFPPGDYQRGLHFLTGNSGTALRLLIGNIGLAEDVRSGILRYMIAESKLFWSITFPYITNHILKMDGITVDARDYREAITAAVHSVLSPLKIPIADIHWTLGDLVAYVPPEDYSVLEASAAEWITAFSIQPDARSLAELLTMLNWPLSDATKNTIASQLLQLNAANWNLDNISSFMGTYSRKTLNLTPEVRERIFRQFADLLIANFDSRGTSQDTFSGVFDDTLRGYIELIKQENYFELYASYLQPLLAKFNPQQTAESNAQYAQRLAAIESLWMNDRIFLYDLKGGTFTTPGYLPVMSDFSRTHKDWVGMIVLAVTGGGEAAPGMAQFNWLAYTTPYYLAYSLLHEGGHAFHMRFTSKAQALDSLAKYWYHNYRNFSSLDTVSGYSTASTSEYIAEAFRYWYADSRILLTEALKRYQDGHPNVLNMMMYAWTLDPPADTPAGMMPLFLLNPETALLETEYLKASWESGDMRNGIFKFELDGKEYRIQYSNYLITSVVKGPIVEEPVVESNLKTLLDGRTFTLHPDKKGSVSEGNVKDHFEEVEQVVDLPDFVLPQGAVKIGYCKDVNGKAYLLYGKPTVREVTLENGQVLTLDLRENSAPAVPFKPLIYKAPVFRGGSTTAFSSSFSSIDEQEKKKKKRRFRRVV